MCIIVMIIGIIIPMTTYNPHKNELNVTIPATGVHELYDYQKGLLGILAGIRVQECDEGLKASIRSVYKLLGHLRPDPAWLNLHGSPLPKHKAPKTESANKKIKPL